jgi:DNA-binding PadR family transcriptional regulator
MAILSRLEEQILLAVLNLKDKAYGIRIRMYLKEVTGETISIGGIYVPLDRLVRKGYMEAYQGDPTPERGGMSKRYYRLTKEGIDVLKESKKIFETLWKNLPQKMSSRG